MPFLRAALIAILALAAPASAPAAGPLAPGVPDRTFASDGTLRASLAGGFEARASQVLPLAGGRLAVVSGQRTVVRLFPSGRTDLRFGTRGVSRLRFRGDGNDRVVALAEDRDRGLVVAGTKRRDIIAVRRLLPNGRVDTGFGAVNVETGGYILEEDVVIASDGSAIVAALVVPPFPAFPRNDFRLIVLALGRDGRPVPSFGTGGTATIPLEGFASRGELVQLPDGRLRYLVGMGSTSSDPRPKLVLAGLTADGRSDPTLGPGGVRALGRLLPGAPTMARDPSSGRLLLVSLQRRSRPHRLVLVALTPDGGRDPAFGVRGAARVSLRFRATGTALAMRANGDAAIATTRLDQPIRPAAALVRRDGTLRRGFGSGGFATVGGFGRRSATGVNTAAIDGLDRLVLGGVTGRGDEGDREDFGRDYVAMARLRLRKAPLSLPARATVSRKGVLRVRVGCRSAGGCRAAMTARRGTLRRRTVFRMRAGTRRVLQLRLGQAGVRLAARHFSMRLDVLVSAAGRLEPLAVNVRLRRTA